jgi:hypothetical protein
MVCTIDKGVLAMFERVRWVIDDDGTLYLFDDEYVKITLQYYKKDTILYARIIDNALIIFDNQAGEFDNGENTGESIDRLLYVQQRNTVFSLLCDNYGSGIIVKKPGGEWWLVNGINYWKY